MSFLAALGIVHPGVFCLAVLALDLTPGPDTAFIVGQSVAHGRRIGFASVLGIALGCTVHTAALALGLSALLAASAGAFAVVKFAGALYLVFLGVRMIAATLRRRGVVTESKEAVAPRAAVTAASRTVGGPGRRAFVQGFVTNVLNPKVVLFFLSFLPQFVAETSDTKAWAFVVLGAIMVAISTVYNAAVVWIAGGVTRRIRGVPRVKAWLDRSIGAAFIALGARIAVAER